MSTHEERPGFSSMRLTAPPTSLFGKLLAIATGMVLLAVGFMFSLLAIAVLVIGGALVFAYLKWKTRHLRSFMDQQSQWQANRPEQPPGGRVIEGEVVSEASDEEKQPETATTHRVDGPPTACDTPASKTGYR
jgi:UPF0716 family protein affecting phage T7 exclusion